MSTKQPPSTGDTLPAALLNLKSVDLRSWYYDEPPETVPEPDLPNPSNMTPAQLKAAFMWLATLEPGLKTLADDVEVIRRAARGQHRFCANEHWYPVNGLKDRMCDLVGWDREKEPTVLRTSWAYRVAYKYLYWARLPNCRRCGEWGVPE